MIGIDEKMGLFSKKYNHFSSRRKDDFVAADQEAGLLRGKPETCNRFFLAKFINKPLAVCRIRRPLANHPLLFALKFLANVHMHFFFAPTVLFAAAGDIRRGSFPKT